MSSLDDRLNADYAPAWRPDPGDRVVGEVVGITERQGEYEPYPIVTVRRDDGKEFAIHAFHTVLAGELARLQPKLGDRIAVKYTGRKEGRSGTSYHAYRAVKDGDESAFSWGKYATGENLEHEQDDGDDLPF